jgi:glycopeptide antibiotics resistance protein
VETIVPGIVAVAVGVALAAVLFVPFAATMYRRHGTMTFARSAGWAAFLIYALGIGAYTLLPLPDPSTIHCVHPQLRPFASLADMRRHGLGSVHEIAANPVIVQLLLNVALFVPLGFFLRGLLRRGVVASGIVGLAWSVLIEVTQVTGVWGVYSCAYRVFDVDDLMTNTLGAVIGGVLARAVIRPSRPSPPVAGGPVGVGVGRRLVGMTCDVVTVVLVGGVAEALAIAAGRLTALPSFSPGVLAWSAPAALELGWVLVRGQTVGDWAVRLRFTSNGRWVLARRLARYAGGIGGYMAILYLATPATWVIPFVIVSVGALAWPKDHRGLPGWVSGQGVEVG